MSTDRDRQEALHERHLAEWWNAAAQAKETEAVTEDDPDQRAFLLTVAKSMRAEALRHET